MRTAAGPVESLRACVTPATALRVSAQPVEVVCVGIVKGHNLRVGAGAN